MSQAILRLVGYWNDSSAPAPDGWPDVHVFLSEDLQPDERDDLVAYLRSGTVFVAFAGFSTCRLCGILNGSTEMTDGEHFVWPEGLSHYVEAHSVRLPAEVLEVARRGAARPVDPLAFERALFETQELTIDEGWWRRLPAIAVRRDMQSAADDGEQQ
jgi:hypothetical protein